jgi:hypothetical protein
MLNRGCVTPQVLHNWQESSQGDMELIDGYDAIPEDAQLIVKTALEVGHVDDEVWNGVGAATTHDCMTCLLTIQPHRISSATATTARKAKACS